MTGDHIGTFSTEVTRTTDTTPPPLTAPAQQIHEFLVRAMLALGVNAHPANVRQLSIDMAERWTVTRNERPAK